MLLLQGVPAVLADSASVSVELEDGAYYAPSELGSVTINASGEFGKVSVFLDKTLLADMPGSGSIDLSAVPTGRHTLSAVAYDADGTELCSDSVKFFIAERSENILWQNDLSDYVSEGAVLPAGTTGSFGSARGSAVIVNKDDESVYGAEHGTVAEISAVGGEDKKENGAYFQANQNLSSVTTVEFDAFISAVPNVYNLQLRYVSGGTKLKVISAIKNSNISGADSTKTYSYEKDAWYHFRFDIDLNKSVSSLTVTKEGETEPTIETGEQSLGINTSSANFRFTMSVTSPGQTALIAFDNFKIWNYISSPVITDISAGGGSDAPIPPESSSVTAVMNTSLDADSVNTDTVKVYLEDKDREAVVSNVTYDSGKITVEFGESLISQSRYRIELSEKIKDEYGTNLKSVLTDWFETKNALLDVTDLKKDISDGKLCISGVMTDENKSGMTLTAVVSVWNGDTLADISYKRIQDGEFITDYVSYQDGYTIQFVIFNTDNQTVMLKDI